MNVYSITNTVSGADLGGYEADDEDGALDATVLPRAAQDAAKLAYPASLAMAQARRELSVDLHTLVDTAQRGVLRLLARRGIDEFAHVQGIAESLAMRPGDVSDALDALVRVGHVERHTLRD